jgi:hypothetical protein
MMKVPPRTKKYSVTLITRPLDDLVLQFQNSGQKKQPLSDENGLTG